MSLCLSFGPPPSRVGLPAPVPCAPLDGPSSGSRFRSGASQPGSAPGPGVLRLLLPRPWLSGFCVSAALGEGPPLFRRRRCRCPPRRARRRRWPCSPPLWSPPPAARGPSARAPLPRWSPPLRFRPPPFALLGPGPCALPRAAADASRAAGGPARTLVAGRRAGAPRAWRAGAAAAAAPRRGPASRRAGATAGEPGPCPSAPAPRPPRPRSRGGRAEGRGVGRRDKGGRGGGPGEAPRGPWARGVGGGAGRGWAARPRPPAGEI